MHHKPKQARIVMLASMQEPAQTQARMHHKHKHARNMNPLCGGSLEGCCCSRREALEVASFVPGQGSHTVVLDGSLFEKEQGGHTFWARTLWSGNFRLVKPKPSDGAHAARR